jgi:hypothetical protein
MDNKDMPAMPPASEICQLWVDDRDPKKGTVDALGLTKREVFAKAAMQAILSNPSLVDNLAPVSVDWLVTKSAIVADAQLTQLDKVGE